MGFRINTNIEAMDAHRNMLNTSGALSKSLGRLSSGLRINRAADDASGLAIADSLRAQSSGLGQAMKNAGDAISLVQVADGALDESSNIVNTIRTKAIQAASDGQNATSRAAIQADIDKLLEEMNIIADTTAFNGQTLLKGGFVNKSFQVGAYANETVSVSIDNADASHVGALAEVTSTTTQDELLDLDRTDITGTSTPAAGQWAMPTASTSSTTGIALNGTSLSASLGAQGVDMLSAKGIAAAINSAGLGVSATAVTELVGTTAVTGGTVADGGLKINGENLGPIDVISNDGDGALVAAINAKTGTTGVSAAVDADGLLTLTAKDGENIAVTGASYALLGTGFATSATSRQTSVAVVAGTAGNEGTVNFTLDGAFITYSAAGDAAADSAALKTALDTAQSAGSLSSYYTFSDAGDGNVTIMRNDGKDINLLNDTDNDTAVTFDTVAGDTLTGTVKNNAYHGTVTLSSASTFALAGDTSTLESFGLTATTTVATGGIIDADVRTADAAQTTIQRADSALTALDKIRSGLGSSQNQVEATLRNISVTRVNIQSAESAIRDVDFAEESSVFAKMNILVQAGSYALSQSNAVQQNIMTLLR